MEEVKPFEFVPQEADLLTWTRLPKEWSISQLIAATARVSTQRDPLEAEAARDFAGKLMSWGHWTPFEFFDLTFSVQTSRAVSHELVRHRLASYMQESQRYCAYRGAVRLIMPDTYTKDLLAQKDFLKACEDACAKYQRLLKEGVPAEYARCVLPECTATRLLVKMNLREFRHFLSLRLDDHAWFEIRQVARMMRDAFTARFPDEAFLLERLAEQKR